MLKKTLLSLAALALIWGPATQLAVGAEAQEETSEVTQEETMLENSEEISEDGDVGDDVDTDSDAEATADSQDETGDDTENGEYDIIAEIDQLIEEANFTNETGYQAWLDYQEFSQSYTLLDLNNFDDEAGTSMEEVREFFGDKDVQIVDNDLGQGEAQMYIRYLDPEGNMLTEDQVVFFGEILMHFVDDKLVYASVQPGFFEVLYEDAIPWSQLGNVSSMSMLHELPQKPYIMSVSQVNVSGDIVTVPGIFTAFEGEEDPEQLVLTLVYPLMIEDPALDDAIVVDVGAHYFEEVSQDFGNWAFIVLQDIIFNTDAGYDDAAEGEAEQEEVSETGESVEDTVEESSEESAEKSSAE